MNIGRNKKGFTLIELIIIIVILGILAAIAIPKYIDIKSDTRKAVASGALGALAGADTILFESYLLRNIATYGFDDVYAAVNPSGWTAEAGTVYVDGQQYNFTYTANGTDRPGRYTRAW